MALIEMFVGDGMLGVIIAKSVREAFWRWRKLALVIGHMDMQREGNNRLG